jgi:serine protease
MPITISRRWRRDAALRRLVPVVGAALALALPAGTAAAAHHALTRQHPQAQTRPRQHSPHSAAFGQQRAYVPHQLIVGYRPRTMATVARAAEAHLGLRRLASAPAPHSRVVTLPAGDSVNAAAARLRRQPGVAYAEPNYIARMAGSFYPNDRGRSKSRQGWEKLQWNLLPQSGINAPWAWSNLLADHHAGGKGVTVAILDTGVAYRRWKQFSRSPDFGETKFVAPYDFIDNNAYPLDRQGHGTFVAGVLAESTNNNLDLAGLAYGASIMPVRVLDSQGEGDETTIARGIRYAVAHGAQIINLSLEFLPSQVKSGSDIPEIVSAIGYAKRHGVIVVGAAGNDEDDQIAYPARVQGVISVGATTKDRCLAEYSNGGDTLDLVAPGGGDDAIVQSDPHCHAARNLPSIYQLTLTDPPHWRQFGFPNYYIGTSMASPEVAATAALVLASRVLGPHPTPDRVLVHLEKTATPLGGSVPNSLYGYGLLNAGAATANAKQRRQQSR